MATNNKRMVFHNFQCSKDFFPGLLITELAAADHFHPRIFARVFALYLIFRNDFAKDIFDIDTLFSYI